MRIVSRCEFTQANLTSEAQVTCVMASVIMPGRCRSLYARRSDFRRRFKGPLNAQIVRQANATRRRSSGVRAMLSPEHTEQRQQVINLLVSGISMKLSLHRLSRKSCRRRTTHNCSSMMMHCMKRPCLGVSRECALFARGRPLTAGLPSGALLTMIPCGGFVSANFCESIWRPI